jgi:hypothetical protein
MAKARYVNIAKATRKRSAAKGTLVGVRLQDNEIKAIDSWAREQEPPVTRPYAIRQLVEIGLATDRRQPIRHSQKTAAKARDLASKTIDKLIDRTAPAAERAVRKRKVLEGPSDVRNVRKDRP